MTKVLVTGGSGFIAAHIVEQLLAKGHSVVTTVRSEAKAAHIYKAHPELGKDRLQIEIVPELTQPDAFDKTVQIPGIEIVLHTASPFHYRVTDPVKDLVDPAVIGTTGILKSIKKYAPQVRRVVITSSFAAILDNDNWEQPSTLYTEKSWNPVTIEDAKKDPGTGYRASKTLAEQAAWDFIKNEKPNFDLATINPPAVLGPIAHHLESLSGINTSNERIVHALTGVWKKDAKIPEPGVALIWVDVRDVAEAHILAGLEKPELGGHRLFTTEGFFDNQQVLQILQKNFPQYADRLPPAGTAGGLGPKEHFQYDNKETEKLLGIKWISLEKSIVDAVKSLQSLLDKA
ncbi:nadph-dependent methylglyoxal reductase gre2 [Ophiostoma piceae UAMH 11346]|uniref:Nadph-dependent methylglyoxal reductase gre2 n=1 Tax=Ophiostoma piceae (strain UAMH 11346) TaxID=1262450 RepID=S3C4H0_OPHP1|nr:nadph-dependent methylglyoxal reductase gre2 [Ophiostoma piceae UAMH 11346]